MFSLSRPCPSSARSPLLALVGSTLCLLWLAASTLHAAPSLSERLDRLAAARASALPLGVGVHTLYEPSPELVIALDAEELTAGLLGVEVTTTSGSRALVESLGRDDGGRSELVHHWISALVIETQGEGRHFVRIRSVTGEALGTHQIRVLGERAGFGVPWKIDPNETPNDDDGDILLVEPGQGSYPATVTLSSVSAAPLHAPSVHRKLEPGDEEPNGDDGDILFGAESCEIGTSALCAAQWSSAEGAKQFSLSDVFYLRVTLTELVELTNALTDGEWELEVFDSAGNRIAPEPETYLLPSETYVVRIDRL